MICAICDRAALNCELTPEADWVCPSCLDNSDLRAGITRAENDLAEARRVACELLELVGDNDGYLKAHELAKEYRWLYYE